MTSLNDVVTDLRAIIEMAAHLPRRAIDLASGGILGGEATVNLAYAPVFTDVRERRDQLELRALDPDDPTPWPEDYEDPDDQWTPLELIRFWSESIRLQLGHNHDDPRWRPTLVSEAAFLRNHDVAEWVWAHETKYDDYAADVARAKAKLENILLEGERSERTPVVCDRCEDGRPLIRVWGDVPADDRWKCGGCKNLFTMPELDTALAAQMRRATPRDWIPRPEAVDLLRSMGHQGRVASRLVDSPETLGWCDLTTHVRWVSWPDAWRRHLVEEQERMMRAKRDLLRKLA